MNQSKFINNETTANNGGASPKTVSPSKELRQIKRLIKKLNEPDEIRELERLLSVSSSRSNSECSTDSRKNSESSRRTSESYERIKAEFDDFSNKNLNIEVVDNKIKPRPRARKSLKLEAAVYTDHECAECECDKEHKPKEEFVLVCHHFECNEKFNAGRRWWKRCFENGMAAEAGVMAKAGWKATGAAAVVWTYLQRGFVCYGNSKADLIRAPQRTALGLTNANRGQN